jgi:uncharacterized surface protein with fasciclin (FAS1) repeats
MVSLGPNTQPYNHNDMYESVHYEEKNIENVDNNTLMDIIKNNPNFTIFANIVKKARFVEKLYDKQNDFTIFVPCDSEIKKKYSQDFIDRIDFSMSKKIMNFSMIRRQIDQNLLESSTLFYLPTLDRSNSIEVKNKDNSTFLSNGVKIIHFNYPSDNGIIHVVDDILIPYD